METTIYIMETTIHIMETTIYIIYSITYVTRYKAAVSGIRYIATHYWYENIRLSWIMVKQDL